LGEDPEAEPDIVETLLRHQVSGLIIAPTSSSQAYLKRWVEQLPVIFIDREPRNLAADLFIEDDRGGAQAAVRHLLAQGHRRIAFVGDSDAVITSHRRWEGYRDALIAAGVPIPEDLVLWDTPSAAGARIEQLLNNSDAPSSIFSSNSRTSTEIVSMLHRLHRTDVALVSFGDFPMATALSPQVTVVDQDPEGLGTAAAQRLLERLDNPRRRYRRKNVLDVTLIDRDAAQLATSGVG
jgi:LacI family transcriptional regulator